jgi:RNA polymerase sigma factor (sigma-70 family)
MAHQHLGVVLRHLRGLGCSPGIGEPTDRQLLELFAANQDDLAFATLVRRHGAMVLGLCRRVLGHEQDAEDAFQAAFLVLAQKASSVRWQDSVGHWLHEVAYRIALRVKTSGARRRAHEREAEEMARPESMARASWRAFCSILDDELELLPQKYRAPLVLCYLEGQAQAVAADRLGCSEATLNRRLAEGRERLRLRLARRGITLSAALLAVGLSGEPTTAAVPALLAASTARAVTLAATGQKAAGLSATVLSLAAGAMQPLTTAKAKLGPTLLLALSFLAGAGLLAYPSLAARSPEQQEGDGGKAPGSPAQSSGDKRPTDDEALPDGALARLGSLRLRQDGGIVSLAFAPDGQTLATGTGTSAGAGSVTLWDVASGKAIRRLEGGVANPRALAFSADGKTLLSCGVIKKDNNPRFSAVQASDTATGKQLLQVPIDEAPSIFLAVFALSPDGKTLATTDKGFIHLLEAASGKKMASWEGGNEARALLFSPDGKQLVAATGGKDRSVRLLDVETGKELRRLEEASEVSVRTLAFSPDGKLLVAPGAANLALLWEAATGKVVGRLEGHTAPVSLVAFSPDGKIIASGSADHTVRLWDPDSGKVLHEWKIDATALAFSPDGKVLAAGTSAMNGAVGTVRLLGTATGQEVGPTATHHAPLHRAAFSGDGNTIATSGKDDAVRLWEASTGKEIRAFADDAGGVSGMNLSPDGKKLTTVGQDAVVRLRDTTTGKELSRFELAPPGPVLRTFFSPDGEMLGTVRPKGEVALWRVADGQLLRSFKGDDAEVLAVAVSPDGKGLALGSGNGNIRIWDVASGKARAWKKRREVLKADPARSLAFAPDGQYLASSHQNSLRIWELATGEMVDEIKTTGALALSPDGRTLAVAGGKQVSLLDLAAANELPTLAGHQLNVNSVAFSADGKRLVSVSDDTTALVWDAARLIPPTKAVDHSKAGLKALWRDLGDEDDAVAYKALLALANSTPAAVALLGERLRPVPPSPEAKRIAGLIADLDSADFETRKKAYDDLDDLDDKAESAIRLALKARPALEVRRQLEKLLSRLDRMSPERLRQLRTLVALERGGSPEACQLLRSLAEGDEGAWLTEEAKNALERIARRPAAAP